MLIPGSYLINRYEIIMKIGSGGMADVYKAKDHVLNRLVAIKVLKQEYSTDATFVKKLREAGADFVKTSTGFLTGHEAHGASLEIIKVMMEECGDKIKIKGSGCIRTREHFLQLIDMGIDRMGVGYRSVSVVLGLD